MTATSSLIQIEGPPDPSLGLVVAIPCRDESRVIDTLDSLWRAERPDCAIEIIVLINASEEDDESLCRRNQITGAEIMQWLRGRRDGFGTASGSGSMQVHVLQPPAMSVRHAGVGLARRMAMNEAARRLHLVGRGDAPIASLDADCVCDPDYLTGITRHFEEHPGTPGCSIYFEHPLSEIGTQTDSQEIYAGIARYELYLRYYRHGLLLARSPYAHYTLGSCLAVRASTYLREGGMSRRQAGEDFYFAQKIMSLGGYTELNATRVVPSARASWRVPFGTGAAIGQWLASPDSSYPVYAVQGFEDIRAFTAQVARWWRPDGAEADLFSSLPGILRDYLRHQGFFQRLAEIRANTASPGTFRQRTLQWFNAFRAMKYIHFATAHAYDRQPLLSAATSLIQRIACERPLPLACPRTPTTLADLLRVYRLLDRSRRPDEMQFW